MTRARISGLVFLVPLVAACPHDGGAANADASTSAGDMSPGSGDAPPASGDIDADGGWLAIGDAILVVPPGALDRSVHITATTRTPDPADGIAFLSPVYEFAPDGLAFAVPAALTIALADPYEGVLADLAIAQMTDDGPVPLLTQASQDAAVTSLEHFSGYVVISTKPVYECGGACGAYQVCCPVDEDGDANDCFEADTPAHCGGCSPCVAPEICCADFASAPQTFSCVDVKANDKLNCGACGVDCSQSALGGPDCCGGLCVDFKTDPKNCGGCGNVCDAGNVCQAGACVQPCTPCVGYDGVEDCCPAGSECHTEPVKGGPCL